MVNDIDVKLLKKTSKELADSVNEWLGPKWRGLNLMLTMQVPQDIDAFVKPLVVAIKKQDDFLQSLSHELVLVLAALNKTPHAPEARFRAMLIELSPIVSELKVAWKQQADAIQLYESADKLRLGIVPGLEREQNALERLKVLVDKWEPVVLAHPPRRKHSPVSAVAGLLLSIASFVSGCASAPEEVSLEGAVIPEIHETAGDLSGVVVFCKHERVSAECPQCHPSQRRIAWPRGRVPPKPQVQRPLADLPAPIRIGDVETRPSRPVSPPPMSQAERDRLRRSMEREIGDLMQQANRVLESGGAEQMAEYTRLVQRIRELQQRARSY
ncbi:hypothetical protein HY490_00555 [Candidatus Woesearchaeota archaeon]|nr:hypothetical protein [Candidatus Woesearchaeota archaeon]